MKYSLLANLPPLSRGISANNVTYNPCVKKRKGKDRQTDFSSAKNGIPHIGFIHANPLMQTSGFGFHDSYR